MPLGIGIDVCIWHPQPYSVREPLPDGIQQRCAFTEQEQLWVRDSLRLCVTQRVKDGLLKFERNSIRQQNFIVHRLSKPQQVPVGVAVRLAKPVNDAVTLCICKSEQLQLGLVHLLGESQRLAHADCQRKRPWRLRIALCVY